MGDDIEAEPKPTFANDGVHLLRTAQQVQYQLSQMADQKASMLLGITFVIFTIAVGQAKLGQPQPALLILGVSAFVAAVSATLICWRLPRRVRWRWKSPCSPATRLSFIARGSGSWCC